MRRDHQLWRGIAIIGAALCVTAVRAEEKKIAGEERDPAAEAKRKLGTAYARKYMTFTGSFGTYDFVLAGQSPGFIGRVRNNGFREVSFISGRVLCKDDDDKTFHDVEVVIFKSDGAGSKSGTPLKPGYIRDIMFSIPDVPLGQWRPRKAVLEIWRIEFGDKLTREEAAAAEKEFDKKIVEEQEKKTKALAEEAKQRKEEEARLAKAALKAEEAKEKERARQRLDLIAKTVKDLESDNIETRRKACVVLGDFGKEVLSAAPALQKVADSDPNEYVRKAAEKALKKIKG